MTLHHVGVAVVGCGTIGRTHVAALSQFPEFTIVSLVDPLESNAEELADLVHDGGRPRPCIVTTLDQALSDPAVELVAITTPSGMHIDQGLAALTAGRHVVIEKPLDVNLHLVPEIERAAAAAAERGIIASVISQHRLDDATTVVRQAITDGRLGTITSAIATSPRWRSQDYYDSGAWRGTWEMDGGGALMNQGVHTLDLLLALMGRPVEIFARTGLLAHQRIEVEDTAVATIEFASGALAVMHASTAAYPGLTSRLQIMGSRGSAIVDNDQLISLVTESDDDLDTAAAPDTDVRDAISHPAGHVRQYADILHAITTRTSPAVTIANGVTALVTVRAVYLSATLRQPIRFDDVVAGRYERVDVRTGGS